MRFGGRGRGGSPSQALERLLGSCGQRKRYGADGRGQSSLPGRGCRGGRGDAGMYLFVGGLCRLGGEVADDGLRFFGEVCDGIVVESAAGHFEDGVFAFDAEEIGGDRLPIFIRPFAGERFRAGSEGGIGFIFGNVGWFVTGDDGSGFDPFAEGCDFPGRIGLSFAGGRHEISFVVGRDGYEEIAAFGIAGDDDIADLAGDAIGVEVNAGFGATVAVAAVAFGFEDREDLGLVVDCGDA